MLETTDIPRDWPVQPIRNPNPHGLGLATCGTCQLTWDDVASTSLTPVPSGRCPFEPFHSEATDRSVQVTSELGSGTLRLHDAAVRIAEATLQPVEVEDIEAALLAGDIFDAAGAEYAIVPVPSEPTVWFVWAVEGEAYGASELADYARSCEVAWYHGASIGQLYQLIATAENELHVVPVATVRSSERGEDYLHCTVSALGQSASYRIDLRA